ncbi:MAG: S41 family peptidase [Elusimicrobiota bacterium]
MTLINRLFAAALAVTLSCAPAFAGPLSLKLGDIKTLRGSGVSMDRISGAPAVPVFQGARVVPAKFTREMGPAGQEDDGGQPPNINQEHFKKLIGGIRELQNDALGEEYVKQLGAGMHPSELQRLGSRLVQLDKMSVDGITGEQWNTVVDSMLASAKKTDAPAKANWPEVVDNMLKEAYASLKDPFSVFMNPMESAAMLKSMSGGGYSGIGAQVAEDPKGVKLDLIFPDSPAEKAGLKDGDVVTAINGVDMAGKTTNEVVERMVGKTGTPVTLSIERGGAKIPDVVVTRGVIKRPNMYSENLGNGVGYVYWSQFSDNSDAEVLGAVAALKGQGVTKVVLDVRANPGGNVGAVAEIVSEFLLDKQEILTFRRQGRIASTFRTDGDGKFKDMQLALLVNGHSASASEIIALAFKDLKRGYVVGSRTYGKGVAQSVLPGVQDLLIPTPQGVQQAQIPTGRIGKVTSERWHGPSGDWIDGKRDPETGAILPGTGGVIPNVAVSVTEDEERAVAKQIMRKLYGGTVANPVQDKVLDKAVELLSRDAG